MNSIISFVFLNFVIFLILALITREFLCWWIKQNKIITLLEHINYSLNEITRYQIYRNIQILQT